MYNYIKNIKDRGLLTEFIAKLFDYREFYDYNYIFRLSNSDNEVIIDIYDNISKHRFNRYIFSFIKGEYEHKTKEENNVFITKIYIDKINDSEVKLYKLAYLFKLDTSKMEVYAKTFLDDKYVKILTEIINKPI